MPHPKTAEQLAKSQVTTPERVVALVWDLVRARRPILGAVLDMGAGDCRFARGGHFREYVGVELYKSKTKKAILQENAAVVNDCVFRHSRSDYDACIGNPPYARHHDVRSPWKEKTIARLERELGISIDKHCNLFLYFLCLGLLKIHARGLLALVIPYEWVSRPSADAIRRYIRTQKWAVDVYRFEMPIFPRVVTTASVTIIDKLRTDGKWSFFSVDHEFRHIPRDSAVESPNGVLEYVPRGQIWAMRGLSPGSQKVFCLTDGERVHHGLRRSDVVPCVTTFRQLPRGVLTLSKATFKRCFVDAGERCWLIKSFSTRRSAALNAYLASVPESKRATYTCENQTPWFAYLPHPVPQLLIGSGFTSYGPKVVLNSIGAVAVGSVFGIYDKRHFRGRRLQRYLLATDFECQIVPHAKSLKKIEVRQFNAVLAAFAEQERANGNVPR